MKIIKRVLPFFLCLGLAILLYPTLSHAYTITEDLSIEGDLLLSGNEVRLGAGILNKGKYMVLNLNQGESKIYDDVHLHITTDDYLFLEAGKKIYNTTDLEV